MKKNTQDINKATGLDIRPVFTDELPEVQQVLIKALNSKIRKERMFGTPVRALHLEPSIFQVFAELVKRCSAAAGYPMPFVFDNVLIEKGSMFQREPFVVVTVWAKTVKQREVQRDELKVAQLN